MRFALIAAALMLAAPAFADEPIKFPEKLQRTDFQFVIADAGPLFVAGQPSEAGLARHGGQRREDGHQSAHAARNG